MTTQAIRRKIEEYMQAYTESWPFSGQVLVAQKGEILFTECYGIANREYDIPVTSETKFCIASMTKSFTATAVMILLQRGQISLNEPLRKYVPEYPKVGDEITIHHLLSHTSGIADYALLPNFKEKYEKLRFTETEFIDLFKNEPMDFPTGTSWMYSNSNYYLLGVIIQRVSGQSFEDFLRENIFEPLGMKNTGVNHNRLILPNRATGYELNGAKLVNGLYAEMDNESATGGIYTTVHDLYLFDRALYSDQLLTREMVELMLTEHGDRYGYGWDVEESFGRKRVGHNGGFNGFASHIYRYPKDEICMIFLSNFVFQAVWALGDPLAAIIFGEEYKMPKRPERVEVDTSVYQNYIGVYESSYLPGDSLTVSTDDGKLYFQLNQDDKFEVIPITQDLLFNHIWIDEKYRFKKDDEGYMWVWGYRRKVE